MTYVAPKKECVLCSRLAFFREENKQSYPDFYNGAVPSFGALDTELLIVGLAPGLKGANATGRPFTGDYAGDILYPSLLRHGFASGAFERRVDDSLALVNCRITNAVRCLPPENKPTGEEVKQCNSFLSAEIKAMPRLKAILTLGGISHKAVLSALGLKQSAYKFTHGAMHVIEKTDIINQVLEKIMLCNSYHTSRYNMNTGRLTEAMFDEVVAQICTYLND